MNLELLLFYQEMKVEQLDKNRLPPVGYANDQFEQNVRFATIVTVLE